jgi:hypothetical protein
MKHLPYKFKCHQCGEFLEAAEKDGEIYIVPCQDCLDDEHGKGFDTGYEFGRNKP